jgi:hypothetical protein
VDFLKRRSDIEWRVLTHYVVDLVGGVNHAPAVLDEEWRSKVHNLRSNGSVIPTGPLEDCGRHIAALIIGSNGLLGIKNPLRGVKVVDYVSLRLHRLLDARRRH